MAREYVDQHVVPQSYLKRFATRVSKEKYIIGTRVVGNNGVPKVFFDSISNVGYVRNFYDVEDKEDPKYWEHFLAKQIDVLCGNQLDNIISPMYLSNEKSVVLNQTSKMVLSKIIMAQLIRVPGSVEAAREIGLRVKQKALTRFQNLLPLQRANGCERIVNDFFSGVHLKEVFFNHSFSDENFAKYCKLLTDDYVWLLCFNSFADSVPFITSDNPVILENSVNSKIGLFHNGLISAETCLYFPLNPEIAVMCFSRKGFVGSVLDDCDGQMFVLNDLKTIVEKNYRVAEQAFVHTFIPLSLFEKTKDAARSTFRG